MKTLSNYIQKPQTRLFEQMGVFFAFSDQQLIEQKKDNIEYVSLGAGMICPKQNVKSFLISHKDIVHKGIQLDIAENGMDNIIYRELCNHECFYVCDPSEAIEALKRYNFPESDIIRVYRFWRDKHNQED